MVCVESEDLFTGASEQQVGPEGKLRDPVLSYSWSDCRPVSKSNGMMFKYHSVTSFKLFPSTHQLELQIPAFHSHNVHR